MDHDLVPATLAQRFMFADEREQGPILGLSLVQCFEIRGALDLERFDRALVALTRRQPVLRMNLHEEAGAIVQRFRDVPSSVLQEHIERDRADSAQARVRRFVEIESKHAFDLATSPLFHASFLRIESDCHAVAIAVHHAVFDFLSYGIMARELELLYDTPDAELPPPRPFAEYARQQFRRLQAGAQARSEAYWSTELRDARRTQLGCDDAASPSAFRWELLEESIPLDEWATLEDAAHRQNVTPAIALLAATALLSRSRSSQDDVLIGYLVGGRTPEFESTIGFFGEKLPIRIRLSDETSFTDLLGQVSGKVLGGLLRADVNWRSVTPASEQPLYGVQLNYLPDLPGELRLAGLEVRPITPDRVATPTWDLLMYFWRAPKGLLVEWEYNAARLKPATVASMWQEFRSILHRLA